MGYPGSAYRNKDGPPGVGRQLAGLAARQHGVVSSQQMYALGLSRFQVRRQVEAGRLHRMYLGVYAIGHVRLSRKGVLLGAVLACGPESALSHRSAAELWGLRPAADAIAVSIPRGRKGPPGLEVHRSRILTAADVMRVDGIPVTNVARTLLDLAALVGPAELARTVDRAERLDLFDLVAVERALSRARGRPGAKALHRAIAGWQRSHTRSELEDRHLTLLETAGLPTPLTNVLLEGECGAHEVDALWRARRLVVQLDGFAFHRTRRDRQRDADTDADLELAGYRVVHLTWDDVVVHGSRTVRRMRQLLNPPASDT